jgi:hypothetical protein
MSKYILIALILMAIRLDAQKYRKFLENSAWCIGGAAQGGAMKDVWYFIKGDTIIDQKQYKIIGSTEISNIYLREDTVDRTVYFKKGNLPEEMMYDFGLKKGDKCSFFMYLNQANGTTDCTVKNVDSILLEDGYHKRFEVEEDRQFGKYFEIIEGVGSMSHAFLQDKLQDPVYWLKCKYDYKNTIYRKDASCNGNIYYQDLSIEHEQVKTFYTLFPNPAYGSISIISERSFELKINDRLGRLVFFGRDIKELSLPAGVYHISFNSNGIIENKTVVFY